MEPPQNYTKHTHEFYNKNRKGKHTKYNIRIYKIEFVLTIYQLVEPFLSPHISQTKYYIVVYFYLN